MCMFHNDWLSCLQWLQHACSVPTPAAPTALVAAGLLHDSAEVPTTHDAAATRGAKDGVRGRGGCGQLLSVGDLTRNYRYIKCKVCNKNNISGMLSNGSWPQQPFSPTQCYLGMHLYNCGVQLFCPPAHQQHTNAVLHRGRCWLKLSRMSNVKLCKALLHCPLSSPLLHTRTNVLHRYTQRGMVDRKGGVITGFTSGGLQH